MADGVVYVLRLTEGKYYVGYTEKHEVMDRVWEHTWKGPTAAEWTKLYAVLEPVDIYPDATQETEKQVTLEYMRKHGWENVRGACYCAVNLKEPPIELADPSKIQQYDLKAQDAKERNLKNCSNCNQPGHFAVDCRGVYCWLCTGKGHVAKDCDKKHQVVCYKCGETGHLRSECPAKENRCFTCKLPGHYSRDCPNPDRKTVQLSKTYGACRRCGQMGHWAASCPLNSNQ